MQIKIGTIECKCSWVNDVYKLVKWIKNSKKKPTDEVTRHIIQMHKMQITAIHDKLFKFNP